MMGGRGEEDTQMNLVSLVYEVDKLGAVVEAIDTEIDHEARISVISGLVCVAKDLVGEIKKTVETGMIWN